MFLYFTELIHSVTKYYPEKSENKTRSIFAICEHFSGRNDKEIEEKSVFQHLPQEL